MKPLLFALAAVAACGCEARPPPGVAPPEATPAPARAATPSADDDTAALLARATANPGEPEAAPSGPRTPAQLFKQVGCANCHRAGAAYHQRILDARSKTEAEIAAWIRNPQKVKPTTAMPPFANLVTEDEALALARWIKAGNPP